jgi:hypothetical protein
MLHQPAGADAADRRSLKDAPMTSTKLRLLIAAPVLAGVLMASPMDAHAYWRRAYFGPGPFVAGAIAGAIVGGALAPRVYAPAPVYVAPPVVYAPPPVIYAAPPVVYAAPGYYVR